MNCALPPPKNRGGSLLRRLHQTPLRDLLRGRGVTARMDWQQVLDTCALPEPLRQVVAQVVGQSRLWRLEKAAVCDELVAHFGDGLAAGETTEELLRNFGEIRRTAQLIRRAKKRQRPLVWHGLKWAGRGLLALVVLYLGLTAWYATDKVVIKVDYLAQINKVALETPESERAWPRYRDTMKKWPALMEEEKWTEVEGERKPNNFSAVVAQLGGGREINPGSVEWKILEKELVAHQEEIAAFRTASGKESMGYVMGHGYPSEEDVAFFCPGDRALYGTWIVRSERKINTPMAPNEALAEGAFSALIPYLGQLGYHIAPVLKADMILAAENGETDRVLADAQSLFGLAKQSGQEPALIGQLVGYTIHQSALNQLAKIMETHPALFTSKMLEKLADMNRAFPVHALDMKGERWMIYDAIESLYTDNGHGDGHFVSANLPQLISMMGGSNRPGSFSNWAKGTWGRVPVSLLTASRREVTQKTDEFFDLLDKESQTPCWKMPSSDSIKIVQEFTANKDSWQSFRFMLPQVFFPVLGNCRRSTAIAQANHSALQLGIALRRHRLAHGHFPAQLSDLVPAYLPELPVDPITGGALHYRLDDKGHPIVYSVGSDRKDDGGFAPVNRDGEDDTDAAQRWDDKTPVAGDWILWPMTDRPLMKTK